MAVITVFQKIDDLNTAAGGTDMDWFLNLPITHLKIFYKETAQHIVKDNEYAFK